MEQISELFKYLGINIALIIAGVMGSLVQVGGQKELGFWAKFTAIISGGAIANYLTPMLVNWFNWSESSQYGFGFMLGFMGLKGVEMVIRAVQKKLGNEEIDVK